MPEETLAFVRKHCLWVGSMVHKQSSTSSILSSMIEVTNIHEYAYMGTTNMWKWKILGDSPDEPQVETMETEDSAVQQLVESSSTGHEI